MGSIQIGEVVIHEDAHSRYCLNDFHRAAVAEGHNARTKEPGKFLASPHIVELVKVLAATAETAQPAGSLPVATVEGRGGGTFACRELVYAYAMWVSAVFHLRVIRVFDAVAQAAQAPVPTHPDMAALLAQPKSVLFRMLADLAEKNEAQAAHLEEQAAQLAAQAPAVKLATDYLGAEGDRCLTDAATALEIPPKAFMAALVEHGICYRRKGLDGESKPRLLPHAEHVTRGYLVNRARLVTVQTKEGPKQKDFSQTMVTPAGMAWLFHRLGHLSTRKPTQSNLLPPTGGQP